MSQLPSIVNNISVNLLLGGFSRPEDLRQVQNRSRRAQMMTNRRLTKHRTGHLYKRDKSGNTIPVDDPRHGTYYLQYRVSGKKVRQSRQTTERDVAERKRLEIMSP